MSLPVYPSQVRGLAYPVEKTSGFNTILQPSPNLLEVSVAQTYNPAWTWKLIYEFLIDDPNNLAAGLTATDYRVLQGFMLAQGGQAKEFLYIDPTDNAVGPALIAGSPNLAAQLQLVNDGVGNYYSPIQRNFGGQFYEDITDLNGAIAVYDDGALKTLSADYTIVGPGLALPGNSYMGLAIKWNSLPAWSASAAYALNATILDPAGHIQKVTTAGTSGSTIPAFNDAGSTTTDNTVVWTDQGYNPGPAAPITAAFNFYFRVRFANDTQDFTQFMNQFWTAGGSDSSGGVAISLKSSRPVSL